MYRRVSLPALLALAVVAASGQNSAPARVSAGVIGQSVGAVSSSGFGGPAVAGAPYSAEEITEKVQTLADGTRITHTSTAKMYRDSEGRTRIERSVDMPGSDNADIPLMIEISDPVAHVHYTLNPRQKVAYKHTMAVPGNRPALRPVPGAQPGKARDIHESARPEVKTAKLGSDTMEGLLVEGTRRTITWPAGSMMGNDRPLTSLSETWTSPDLKIVVLSRVSDPRNGEHTRKLVNVSRAEPDPGLFQPSTDYTVMEDGRPAPR
jgi:hypothetical protein